jgi:hypothetical protein
MVRVEIKAEMALSSTTMSSTLSTTDPSENEMSSTQYAIVVSIAIGYPILMLLVVLGCKRLMLHYGPFTGMSYEEVL